MKYIIKTYQGEQILFETELEIAEIGKMINERIYNGDTFFSYKELIRYSDIDRVIPYEGVEQLWKENNTNQP